MPLLEIIEKTSRPGITTAFLLAILAGWVSPPVLAAGQELAERVIREADAIRLPQQEYQTEITITNISGDKKQEPRQYRVFSKGHDDTVVQITHPAAERGQILLMKGRDLWAFMPAVSQPIRLSLAQRLTGQVANGDLARANFSGDYTATLLRTEVLNDVEYYVLDLRATNRNITYHQVLYWVTRKNFRPYRAEFYSASGKLLKTCLYTEFRQEAGAIRPTRLIIDDALRAGERSILDYGKFVLRPLPDKLFTKEYLKKLQ